MIFAFFFFFLSHVHLAVSLRMLFGIILTSTACGVVFCVSVGVISKEFLSSLDASFSLLRRGIFAQPVLGHELISLTGRHVLGS